MSRRNPLKKKRSFAQRGTSPGTWGNTLQQCNCVARLKGPPEERSGLGSTLVGNARTLRLETCRTASDRVTKGSKMRPCSKGVMIIMAMMLFATLSIQGEAKRGFVQNPLPF